MKRTQCGFVLLGGGGGIVLIDQCSLSHQGHNSMKGEHLHLIEINGTKATVEHLNLFKLNLSTLGFSQVMFVAALHKLFILELSSLGQLGCL